MLNIFNNCCLVTLFLKTSPLIDFENKESLFANSSNLFNSNYAVVFYCLKLFWNKVSSVIMERLKVGVQLLFFVSSLVILFKMSGSNFNTRLKSQFRSFN